MVNEIEKIFEEIESEILDIKKLLNKEIEKIEFLILTSK